MRQGIHDDGGEKERERERERERKREEIEKRGLTTCRRVLDTRVRVVDTRD